MSIKNLLLNNKREIPSIGFGTWLIDNEEAPEAVTAALETGYTMVDTASYYKNEEGVGKGIKDSGIDREGIFLTSKLWNDDHGYDNALAAIDISLKKLGTDYLDLYLVHWPVPVSKRENWEEDIAQTWRAMEKIYNSGMAKAVGVSNFLPHHLECLKKSCNIMPAINQIEYHVSYMQEETVEYCEKNNIIVQAWSPLARGGVFEIKEIQDIADKYNKSAAQICLIWEIQKGIIPIPKTLNRKRMMENLDIFDVSLSREEMNIMDNIKICQNSGHHPDSIDF